MIRRIVVLGALLLAAQDTVASARSTLDWMAGHWCMHLGDNTFEEFWLPPHLGQAIGLGRAISGEHVGTFEYMRIVEEDGLRTFIAQPGGAEPTTFLEVDSGTDWIRFENPDHDFPQRVEYRREGDRLHAIISGPGADGDDVVLLFDYGSCDSRP